MPLEELSPKEAANALARELKPPFPWRKIRRWALVIAAVGFATQFKGSEDILLRELLTLGIFAVIYAAEFAGCMLFISLGVWIWRWCAPLMRSVGSNRAAK